MLIKKALKTKSDIYIAHMDFVRTSQSQTFMKEIQMPRSVAVNVTSIEKGYAHTYGYPAGTGHYVVPLYLMYLEGDDENNICQKFTFKVMRFGVQQNRPDPQNPTAPASPPKVVGLSQQQSHKLKAMVTKSGSVCWQILDNHLLHSGSPTPMLSTRGVGAVIGCIAVTGESWDDKTKKFVSDWDSFNEAVYRLSGTRDRREITIAQSLSIHIAAATTPPLERWE